jgi:DNA polymerase III alpha subunit
MAGVVVSKQERTSLRQPFRLRQLSDASGIFETMVFSERWRPTRRLVPGTMVFLTADVRTEGDLMRLTAQTFRPLDEGGGGGRRPAHLPAGAEALDGIKTIIQRTAAEGEVSLS